MPPIPWSVDPPHFPGKGRVFALATLLDGQRLQIVPQGAHSNVHLLDKKSFHVFQHKLWHQLSVLWKCNFNCLIIILLRDTSRFLNFKSFNSNQIDWRTVLKFLSIWTVRIQESYPFHLCCFFSPGIQLPPDSCGLLIRGVQLKSWYFEILQARKHMRWDKPASRYREADAQTFWHWGFVGRGHRAVPCS